MYNMLKNYMIILMKLMNKTMLLKSTSESFKK